ncbi:hypothetical protein TUN199_01769 [Pyrenophora tritici-repentis]|nr:hypothetical protein Alg130_03870 [Pyrenophora tritici-repentis]KAI0589499.1 hypothetical protein Alg215_00293 [Pyrenophora tritici-repentis]KAI0626251.1 hypothetical protein TUN199_01769 [Pyrenophora tritici-repentis]KAI1675238.1 hypothetical protein L13192_01985 [Pyrenophora tritici-repentis]KAI1687610.1 hypothetical protein KJE20_00787 [Pyrenophora tritici-repentis]
MRKGDWVSGFTIGQFSGSLKTSLPSTEQLLSLAEFTAVSYTTDDITVH